VKVHADSRPRRTVEAAAAPAHGTLLALSSGEQLTSPLSLREVKRAFRRGRTIPTFEGPLVNPQAVSWMLGEKRRPCLAPAPVAMPGPSPMSHATLCGTASYGFRAWVAGLRERFTR
jgi:hypothetical protein